MVRHGTQARTHTHTPALRARTHGKRASLRARTRAGHANMHARTQARTHSRTHARTNVRTQAYTHERMYARMHARTHACTHVRTHARTRACTHARTDRLCLRTHAHIYARMYARACVCGCHAMRACGLCIPCVRVGCAFCACVCACIPCCAPTVLCHATCACGLCNPCVPCMRVVRACCVCTRQSFRWFGLAGKCEHALEKTPPVPTRRPVQTRGPGGAPERHENHFSYKRAFMHATRARMHAVTYPEACGHTTQKHKSKCMRISSFL